MQVTTAAPEKVFTQAKTRLHVSQVKKVKGVKGVKTQAADSSGWLVSCLITIFSPRSMLNLARSDLFSFVSTIACSRSLLSSASSLRLIGAVGFVGLVLAMMYSYILHQNASNNNCILLFYMDSKAMGRRPNTTLPEAPVSIRMSPELQSSIDTAAALAKMTSTDFMRLCMRIGIEHFKRIDYDTAKCIVEAVEGQSKKTEIHGLNETMLGPPSTEPAIPPRQPVTYPKPKRQTGGGSSSSLRHAADEHHKDEGHDGMH